MTDHTHDAWILGTHELPDDLPHKPRNIVDAVAANGIEGVVLVHDLDTDRWVLVDAEHFDAEYEFV